MKLKELVSLIFGSSRPATALPAITSDNPAWKDFFSNVPGLPLVTEQTALLVSAVYACVNLISGAISALPAHIFRLMPDGERELLPTDDYWWLLNEQFSPRFAAAAGWEYLVHSLLLHGDAFALIQRQGAQITGILPVHPRLVTVLVTPDYSRLVYSVVTPDHQTLVVDQDDMIHVPGFGFDGYRGLSPLRHHLRMTGAVALATQEYAAKFFSNGARPDIVLKSDQAINQETADRISFEWAQRYAGLDNAHKPAVLGSGFSAEPLSLNAEDAQLLATRQFQIEEIARIYGVPPFMIGHMQKTTSWGSGVETMGTGFVRFTLRQHLNKFQNEINRKFFRRAGKFIEFDTFELERADMESLFASYRQAIGGPGLGPGFMTAEEIRNRLNLTRTPKFGELVTADPTAPPADAAATRSKKKKTQEGGDNAE